MGKASRRKREEKHYVPNPFEALELPEATKKCGRKWDRNNAVLTNCPVCDQRVVLHCTHCKCQISGCFCVAKQRMSEEDYQQFVGEFRKRRAREAGIVLPGD